MNKRDIIKSILSREGGFVDHPLDSGGATNYGITQAVARSVGYTGDMRDLTQDEAIRIYSTLYYEPMKCDEIILLSPEVAHEIFDTAVNCGTHRSATFLQRSLNALNSRGDYWNDLTVDGVVGSRSVEAVRQCINYHGDEVLTKALNCLQGAFYIELTEKREKDEVFLVGWLNHRVSL